jgi:hypothetical protein
MISKSKNRNPEFAISASNRTVWISVHRTFRCTAQRYQYSITINTQYTCSLNVNKFNVKILYECTICKRTSAYHKHPFEVEFDDNATWLRKDPIKKYLNKLICTATLNSEMDSGILAWYISSMISLHEVRFYDNVTWWRLHPVKDIVTLKIEMVAGILVSFIFDDNATWYDIPWISWSGMHRDINFRNTQSGILPEKTT